jgi:hypothetical protein
MQSSQLAYSALVQQAESHIVSSVPLDQAEAWRSADLNVATRAQIVSAIVFVALLAKSMSDDADFQADVAGRIGVINQHPAGRALAKAHLGRMTLAPAAELSEYGLPLEVVTERLGWLCSIIGE